MTRTNGTKSSRRAVSAGTTEPEPTWRLNPAVIASRWGWKGAGRGRAAVLDPGAVYLSSTVQTAGLYPFILGGGLPPEGVPIGYDQLTHELVCFDPSGWIGSLVTNPGVWIMAQPGVGKSAIAKRICLVYSAYGYKIVVPGDVKGEYADLVGELNGQVVRIGRGLDRINPLDSGPLRKVLPTLAPGRRDALLAEITGRRSELLHALLTTEMDRRPDSTERNVIEHAIRLVGAAHVGESDPIIPDVVKVLRDGPAELRAQLMVDTEDDYRALVRGVTHALENLCVGPLSGLFDGPTTTPLDLSAPALSVDLSSLLTAGDHVVSAGLLATWAYAYSSIDSARAVGLMNAPLVLPLDEMWRALRAGPGIVDAFDSMTRLNRARNEVTLFITHSLRDPESLPTPQDRAKAMGMIDRCDSMILGALSVGELERVSAQRPLTDAEIALIASWSDSSGTGLDLANQKRAHPGRGKYMLRLGTRPGTPVRLQLTDAERRLYETDPSKMLRKGAA
ncbi:ATP-binding protein [Streptomyces sp. IB2014 011-1]|uniref:ATP-binding protein n=1 Tax=Streptomyces sp. IB2014 011-1 TaxID=1844478 RepID=UPI0009A247DF|nr:ATP-binding protein [Streptomyces sp. IB2014 011-1]ONI48504.1 AAA-like domain protein [Streptomyces sp. IB2014 011-1]